MLDGIKNIIFDLGKVIINVYEDRTVRAFEELGFEDAQQFYNSSKDDPIYGDYEKGLVTTERFREMMRRGVGIEITDVDFDKAWSAMLGDIPVGRKELLKRLSENYKLILLSNTDEMHMREIFRIQNRRYGKENLFPWFDREYYSYMMGIRKPDPAIFEMVLQQSHLEPAETLYVDDGERHVRSAETFGIKGVWLQGDLLDLLWN
ncbi:MAG: HAD family phosphatase [Bacteroidetes bacterium]|nr:HAD family phosphatase [Bacteroidota bacterium]